MTLQKYIVMARAYCGCERGAAAAELALVVTLLTIPLLNVIDLGTYAYQRMQVENAAQTGADQVRSLCNTPTKLPAVTVCNGTGITNTIVTNYIQNTSLGTSVTLAASSPVVEAFYCALTDGTLQQVGTAGSPGTAPSLGAGKTTCGGGTGFTAPPGKTWSFPTGAPGDYIKIAIRYTYTPIFSNVSVTSLLLSPITQSAMSRLK